jgi:UDP-GlcNAc:undecaprenyl-phosphate GlcNAc-1-phosphate transferase
MLTVLLVFSGALAFAIGGTPVAQQVAWRSGMTDTPSARRVHERPTPLLGGLAIYGAVMLALLVFGDRSEVAQLAGILIAATLVSFLGLWDDRRPLRPVVKLAGQLAAVGVMVAAGVRVQLVGVVPLDVLLTVVWVVVLTNALNFMDNMDGLAGGVAGIAAAFFLLLALGNGQELVAPLAAAVLGACIGFLVYNFNPARIFMGDGGSLFLGLLLAALAIKLRFPGRPVSATWIVPVLVLAVPLFDLALVSVSRVRRGVNPFTTAGTDHLSHRLATAGLSHRQAAVAVYCLATGCGLLGVAASVGGSGLAWALLVLAALLGLAGMWLLEFAPDAPRPRGSTENAT